MDDSLYRATQAARPPTYRPAPPSSGSGRAVVAFFALLAIVAVVVGLVLIGEVGGESEDEGAAAPLIAAPEAPFKNAYQGPQKAVEAPPDRSFYATLGRPAPPTPAQETQDAAPKAAVSGPPKQEPAKAANDAPPQSPTAPQAGGKAKAQGEVGVQAAVRFQPAGGFVVQLGAYRSADAADRAWRQALAAAKDILTGASSDIQRAAQPDGGAIFRLRAGFLSDRETAAAVCRELTARNHPCLATPR